MNTRIRDKFPLSDLSYQNIDWVIKKTNDTATKVDDTLEEIEAVEERVNEALGQVEQYEDRLEAVESSTQVLSGRVGLVEDKTVELDESLETVSGEVDTLFELDGYNVKLTGNQSIADTKTFENIIVSGDLTLDNDADLTVNGDAIFINGLESVADVIIDADLNLGVNSNINPQEYSNIDTAIENNYVVGASQISDVVNKNDDTDFIEVEGTLDDRNRYVYYIPNAKEVEVFIDFGSNVTGSAVVYLGDSTNSYYVANIAPSSQRYYSLHAERKHKRLYGGFTISTAIDGSKTGSLNTNATLNGGVVTGPLTRLLITNNDMFTGVNIKVYYI